MNQSVKLLKHLIDVNSITGYEIQAKEAIRNYVEPVSDQITENNLGGILGKKNTENGQYPTMISGHMDEVGFMVTKVDKHDFISFTPVGGWWSQVMLSQKVTITTDSGKEIRGIIGSKPPHVLTPEEHEKPMKIKNMFIGISASSKEETEEAGVEVGNMVTSYSEFEVPTNDRYLAAKAFNSRYGCALAIGALRRLKDENIGASLYSGATVQEEVSLHGARVAANTIKPDLTIAVDVDIAYDTLGISGRASGSKLDGGPVVVMMDATSITHRGLRKHTKDVAREHDIEVQWDTTPGGGTDAGSIHVTNEGIPTMAIGATLRYMHSSVSVLNVDNYGNSIRLVTEIARPLNNENYKNIMW